MEISRLRPILSPSRSPSKLGSEVDVKWHDRFVSGANIMKKPQGFTLIELLVVIAIIGMLMGVLLTALRAIREQTWTTICQARLRQWSVILRVYVDENDGKFFTGAVSRLGHLWPLQLTEELKDWKQNKLWFCPKATKPSRDEAGVPVPPAQRDFFTAWGIDRGPPVGGLSFPENGISGSYGLNGYLMPITGPVYDSGVPRTRDWRNYDQITQAGNVPTMVDALQYNLWPLSNNKPGDNEEVAWSSLPRMEKACIDRHNCSVNVSFADSSVRKVGLKELWKLRWYKRFDINGPMTLAGGVTRDDWPDWIRRCPDY